MFFLHIKNDTEKLVHTACTQKFLQTDFFARRNFTQSSFYTAESFSHKPLRTKNAQLFLQTDGSYTQKVLRTEVLGTEGFMHNIFFHTDAFIHRCFYTEDELHTETCAHSTLLHQLLHREVSPDFTPKRCLGRWHLRVLLQFVCQHSANILIQSIYTMIDSAQSGRCNLPLLWSSNPSICEQFVILFLL